MALYLTGYFDRINYRGNAEPNLNVLQDLVTAHTRSIPFENLDPLLGVPVDDLSPEALFDKLVCRRRGGYCYEQNGLMGCVLVYATLFGIGKIIFGNWPLGLLLLALAGGAGYMIFWDLSRRGGQALSGTEEMPVTLNMDSAQAQKNHS